MLGLGAHKAAAQVGDRAALGGDADRDVGVGKGLEIQGCIRTALGLLIAQPDCTDPAASTHLSAQLAQFAEESSRPYPLLGLTEVRCWLGYRLGEGEIREVFLRMLG